MMWHKHALWLFVFLLFLLEGSLLPWLLPDTGELKLQFIPHFAWVVIIFITIYLSRHMGLALALVFGILHDIVYYGHVLGVYAFGMGLATYIIGLLLRNSHVTWYIGIGTAALGLILFDIMVYSLYMLFQIVSISPWWIVQHVTLPSLLLNVIFASAIYYPAIKVFAKIEKYMTIEEQDSYPTGNP